MERARRRRPVSGAPAGFTGAYVNAGRARRQLEYLKFVREDMAVGAAMHVMVDSVESTATADAVSVRDRVGVSFPFVVRWNPVRRFTSWRTVEPYLRGAVGPLIGAQDTMRTVGGDLLSRDRHERDHRRQRRRRRRHPRRPVVDGRRGRRLATSAAASRRSAFNRRATPGGK